MEGRHLRHVVCLFFFYLGVNAYSHRYSHQSQNILNRLLGRHSSKPMVVFLKLGNSPRSSEFDDLLNINGDDGLIDDEEDSYRNGRHHHESLSSSSASDDDAYFLNHLLRKPKDDSDSSSSSNDISEPARQALRTALRARCQKVDKCVQRCPAKKPSCPFNCQQVFDNLNLCPPPPPPDPCEEKPKCGKTMPPGWRF